MTVEEMIAKADALLSLHERSNSNVALDCATSAQAWLMRADLELRLQERRSAFAAVVTRKMDEAFRHSPFYPPRVIPMAGGDGFLVTLSNGHIRDEKNAPWGVVLEQALSNTRPFTDAGWKLQFAFDGVDEPCSKKQGHEFYYMAENEEEPWKPPVRTPMPYCCRCAALRPIK